MESRSDSHFQTPIRDLARLVLDVNVEPGVRIGPRDLRDGARQREGLVSVEFRRKRVVRDEWPKV